MVSRRRMSRAFAALDQHLGRTQAGVVVGALRHAVGAGIEQRNQVAGLDGRELAVAGEEVAGLADRADYIHDARPARRAGARAQSRDAPGRAPGG